ncbi:hypothetical protein POM88_016320 [Heracleum sosnowskyi]|uniref:Cupin type-1 domain-containing protein n=1 Tax=Heracleum sosnowskyi TaxID=360622 RepID=A0AAD8MX87_9APIA|nr:hypothetical protein POM88_016320 [Heracleum sosnowskyi]
MSKNSEVESTQLQDNLSRVNISENQLTIVHFKIFASLNQTAKRNVGKGNAMAVAGLSSQNPGVITIVNAVFGSEPAISSDILAKAFQNRCVNIIANLFNAPLEEDAAGVGVGTIELRGSLSTSLTLSLELMFRYVGRSLQIILRLNPHGEFEDVKLLNDLLLEKNKLTGLFLFVPLTFGLIIII